MANGTALTDTPAGSTIRKPPESRSRVPYPNSAELDWLYAQLSEAVEVAPDRSKRGKKKGTPCCWRGGAAAVAIQALQEHDIHFQCSCCNSILSLSSMADSFCAIETARRQSTLTPRRDDVEQHLQAQREQFQTTSRHLSKNHFSVFDTGSSLCLTLLSLRRCRLLSSIAPPSITLSWSLACVE